MITKRTQNAALVRYKVVNYVLEACKSKDFSSVHVSEICKASDISKVTFFKYFDHKEDVLMLYMSIINTGICIEVSERQLESVDGLNYTIERFGAMLRETPSIAKEIVSAIIHTRPPVLPILLTESDKALFFPNTQFTGVNLRSFWDLIEGFMLEGILNSDITKITGPAELTNMFTATIYGAIITGHIKGRDGQQAIIFNNICKSWLRCLH